MPDPSPSTLTVLNSNFLQLGRRIVIEWSQHTNQYTTLLADVTRHRQITGLGCHGYGCVHSVDTGTGTVCDGRQQQEPNPLIMIVITNDSFNMAWITKVLLGPQQNVSLRSVRLLSQYRSTGRHKSQNVAGKPWATTMSSVTESL